MNKADYIFLYQRDLKKLKNEISLYKDEESLWIKLPGTINSGGNIAQHLIGNLRTYIGLALGHYSYIRDREAEFSSRLFTRSALLDEVDLLVNIVTNSLNQLDDHQLGSEFPPDILTISETQSIGLVLTHLSMHLAYHTGQINYHRRIVGKHDENN